uniref:Cnidarian restricted protein n=1 Tax=Clytia hemisphaerica TaxID=252671 RepID=A0A7M5XD72_9CNID
MKILLKILLVAVIVKKTLSVSSVKPVNGVSSTTVSIGNDALFQWNIVLENGDQDVGLKLLNGTTELWTQQWGKVSVEGKALFKDRLTVEKSVTYLKATIKNVDFNDSTIELRITGAILDNGFTKLSDIDSTISLIVQG